MTNPTEWIDKAAEELCVAAELSDDHYDEKWHFGHPTGDRTPDLESLENVVAIIRKHAPVFQSEPMLVKGPETDIASAEPALTDISAEQQVRDWIEALGWDKAQELSAGDLVFMANALRRPARFRNLLKAARGWIGRAGHADLCDRIDNALRYDGAEYDNPWREALEEAREQLGYARDWMTLDGHAVEEGRRAEKIDTLLARLDALLSQAATPPLTES